jgi:hypothetical protein
MGSLPYLARIHRSALATVLKMAGTGLRNGPANERWMTQPMRCLNIQPWTHIRSSFSRTARRSIPANRLFFRQPLSEFPRSGRAKLNQILLLYEDLFDAPSTVDFICSLLDLWPMLQCPFSSQLMKIFIASIALLVIASTACEKKSNSPPSVPASRSTLTGKYVIIQLSRAALGLASGKPISRDVDTSDGIRLTVSGHVIDQTDTFVVIGRYPERERNEGVQWIPLTSILAINEPTNQNRNWESDPLATVVTPQSWQFEAIKNLTSTIGIKIPRSPAGRLTLWVERDGERELLDDTTVQDIEQWLYIGIDPVHSNALFASFVTKENPRGGIAFFHGDDLNPFRSQVTDTTNWTQPVLVALESNGKGKIYAQIIPDR